MIESRTRLGADAHDEVGSIRSLILKHARDAFVSDETIEAQWRELNFQDPPGFAEACREYDRFVETLLKTGAEIHFLTRDPETGLDSIYVRDCAIASRKGLILCRMGKEGRAAEPEALGQAAHNLGLPIVGRIRSPGCIEGGDVVWLDQDTLAVGRGYRTNDEGIAQLEELLSDCVPQIIRVPLPHWRGPNDVFHLMSILSPLDKDLAVVYSPLLPVPFREELLERGYRLVEVPDSEFQRMGCNVLALAPRHCLMLEGNPITRDRLQAEGVEVVEYRGEEISRKGAGGPTCLTRPLRRQIGSLQRD